MRPAVERRYPPYEGSEPYLFLCFSDADLPHIEPLIERLFGRGVRLWYVVGRSADTKELSRRNERADRATLTVLYISENSRHDKAVKDAVLECRQKGRALVAIDADDGDHELSVGLTGGESHIAAWRLSTPDELEEKLLHAGGFVQELIGPRPEPYRVKQRRLALRLAAATAVVCLCGVVLAWHLGIVAPASAHPGDTEALTSPQLVAAARRAQGGGALTDEGLAQIVSLRLEELPDDPSELAQFSALRRVEVPQSLAVGATALLGGSYDVVLVEA